MTQLLNLEGIRVQNSNTGQDVVHSFSAAVNRGEVLGIVGESGSGKSITCRSILGILPKGFQITEGHGTIFGEDLRALGPRGWHQLRGVRIGAVFQDPGSYLNPSIRVGPQVAEAIRIRRGPLRRKEARQRTLQVFERVHLSDPRHVYEQYPHELSGGMLQRVLIAAAISLEPEILIADEATTALDVTVQAEILDLLLDLKEQSDMALIVVSHDLAVVAQLCESVLVMREGHVVDRGPTQELLFNPQHDYTKLLVNEHEQYGIDRFLRSEARTV